MVSHSYRFGRNWREFLDHHADATSLEEARNSLTAFLPFPVAGRSFLDAGCGSGLFSLAARKLGASSVTSFDVDPESAGCCRELRSREGDPADWTVTEGSLLQDAFMASLPHADIVYCWGVAHHTGAMWRAIDNLLGRVAEGGCLYLAIYNKAEGFRLHPDGRFGGSRFWLWEKRLYVSLPRWLQRLVDAIAATLVTLVYLLTLRNPLRMYASHRRNRGMSFMTNLRDWLGGYPYEFATVAEIRDHVLAKGGWRLERVTEGGGLLNNEFLFVRDKVARD